MNKNVRCHGWHNSQPNYVKDNSLFLSHESKPLWCVMWNDSISISAVNTAKSMPTHKLSEYAEIQTERFGTLDYCRNSCKGYRSHSALSILFHRIALHTIICFDQHLSFTSFKFDTLRWAHSNHCPTFLRWNCHSIDFARLLKSSNEWGVGTLPVRSLLPKSMFTYLLTCFDPLNV